MFDVTKTDLNGIMVGGLIQCMETDSKGKYLAVMFQDTSTIALFSIVRQPTLQLLSGYDRLQITNTLIDKILDGFSSLVVGLPEEKPSAMSFQHTFDVGACLTIAWSSGRVQYYPIIYTDLANSTSENLQPNRSVCRSFNLSRI